MIDITDQKFGRLTVLKFSRRERFVGGTRLFWVCECECGNITEVAGSHLRNGHTTSCGCEQRRRAAEAKRIHGFSSRRHRHFLSSVFAGMWERCTNPKNISYKYYGARGITICKRWKSIANFIEDMAPSWRPGLTLDRRNNNGDYSPGNCRWATWSEQNRNKRKRATI